jgi:membrane-bound ClpP family serine protease
MNFMSRTITGIILIFGGSALIAFSFFSSFVFLIHGLVVLVLGLFIYFNKNEDKIEKIKNVGGKK